MVRLETSMGDILVELNDDEAPVTTRNFIKYVEGGFYDGTIFHRIINGFVVQGGGLLPGLTRKQADPLSGDPIENEATNGLKNTRGTLSMARTSDPHSATSQFFINLSDNDFLDHKSTNPDEYGYAVFGRVRDGMEVVDAMSKVPTGARDVPRTDVVLTKATIQP